MALLVIGFRVIGERSSEALTAAHVTAMSARLTASWSGRHADAVAIGGGVFAAGCRA